MNNNKIKQLFLNIKYAVNSLSWKKSKSVIVFDAWFGQRFADNSRNLFQFISENKEQLGIDHCVWVTRNENLNDELNKMGYESYMLDSEESVKYHKQARYHIVCNNPTGDGSFPGELLAQYSYRAKRINLWHGAGPIKTLGIESNEHKIKKSKNKLQTTIKEILNKYSSLYRLYCTYPGGWGDSYLLCTSNYEKEKFIRFYPEKKNKIIVSGYPRNAYQCKCTENEEKIKDVIGHYQTSILYLPTFRSQDSKFDSSMLCEDLKELIKNKNILWIQKAHAADNKSDKDFSYKDNILNLSSDFDINILTPQITFVITDYSSILADALYHYKPVLLYMPDYNEYMNSDRGLADDASFILSAGMQFFDTQSLKEFLGENYNQPENAKTNSYIDVRTKIWGTEDKTIKQIWDDILRQTK